MQVKSYRREILLALRVCLTDRILMLQSEDDLLRNLGNQTVKCNQKNLLILPEPMTCFQHLNELAISLKILSHPGHGISSAGQRKLDLLEILE